MFGSAHFALSRGVAELGRPAAWLNGLLLKGEEGLPWQQLLPYNLQAEQQRLQVRSPGHPPKLFYFRKDAWLQGGLSAHAEALFGARNGQGL